MKEFVGLREKTYRYLMMKIKEQKSQKTVSYKENLNFKIIKTV